MHFKAHRLASQWVIEVKQNFIGAHFAHRTCKRCVGTVCAQIITNWRRKLHHITHTVFLQWIAMLREQLFRDPLNHFCIALAKSGTGWQVKAGVCAFF